MVIRILGNLCNLGIQASATWVDALIVDQSVFVLGRFGYVFQFNESWSTKVVVAILGQDSASLVVVFFFAFPPFGFCPPFVIFEASTTLRTYVSKISI